MYRETNMLGFTVTCKYCDKVYMTTSTAELARYTRDHRTRHLGPRPGTPLYWAMHPETAPAAPQPTTSVCEYCGRRFGYDTPDSRYCSFECLCLFNARRARHEAPLPYKD